MIRADASSDIGTGHVLRCIVVAGWLRAAGHDVAFAVRALPGNLIARIRADGFPAYELDDRDAAPAASWLGVSLHDECAAMGRLIEEFERAPQWIVLDHFELGEAWERAVAAHGCRIVAIDDLANRPHDVEAIVDANLGPLDRYDALVPARARRLLGPKYVPVRDAFVTQRLHRRPRDGSIRRILVFYGGVDWTDETSRALRVLKTIDGDFAIDVVVGYTNPRRDDVIRAIAADPRAVLCAGDAEMAAITATADLALGAIGGALWERFFVGCPSIVTTMLAQLTFAAPLVAATGAAIALGDARDVSDAMLREAIEGVRENSNAVREMSDRAFALCEGYENARAEFVALFAKQ